MKEENRVYADEAMEIVNHAAYEIGSRLPGTDGEIKLHKYMGEKLKAIGIEPKTEEFAVSPRSSIGGLSYAGWSGVILSVLSYFAFAIKGLWFAMAALAILTICWLVFSCFFYKTWFDMFFPQEISRNTLGVLEPEDGEYDYTIILSGHTDTSWCWRHSEHAYKYKDTMPVMGLIATYGKVGFGAVCFFAIALFSIFMAVLHICDGLGAGWVKSFVDCGAYDVIKTVMYFAPIVTAIGCLFVVMWGDPNPRNASRGAMDNATGIGLSYAVLKYFKENPDKMPKRCRIIDANIGSEEAGLRGSMAFAQEHRFDDMTQNAWNINIDSVADEDYFEVVIKDDWQGVRFDTDLEKMFKDTFAEMGIESKTDGCIHNPVGGCDSTPMTRAGIKSVTFAAQNPMLTYYYHTWRDMPDRFSVETVGKGFDVVLSVIDKIANFQETKGYNGPQKK